MAEIMLILKITVPIFFRRGKVWEKRLANDRDRYQNVIL